MITVGDKVATYLSNLTVIMGGIFHGNLSRRSRSPPPTQTQCLYSNSFIRVTILTLDTGIVSITNRSTELHEQQVTLPIFLQTKKQRRHSNSTMSKRFNEKRAALAAAAIERELDSGYGKVDESANAEADLRAAAMGKGEEELFERKMSKEEKKAAAKAAREAKKKVKSKKDKKGGTDDGDEDNGGDGDANGNDSNKLTRSVESEIDMQRALEEALKDNELSPEAKRDAALEWLSLQNIVVTYEAKKGKLHANTRDINVSGVTVTFHGKPLIEDTELTINYGNRYGFIGPNGSGKSTGTFACQMAELESFVQ